MGQRIIQGISANSDIVTIGADTAADLPAVGTAYPMGSLCYIIDTGKVYMLNSLKEWKLQP